MKEIFKLILWAHWNCKLFCTKLCDQDLITRPTGHEAPAYSSKQNLHESWFNFPIIIIIHHHHSFIFRLWNDCESNHSGLNTHTDRHTDKHKWHAPCRSQKNNIAKRPEGHSFDVLREYSIEEWDMKFGENLFSREVLVHNSKLLQLIESFRVSFRSFRNWTNIQMLSIYNFNILSKEW